MHKFLRNLIINIRVVKLFDKNRFPNIIIIPKALV